MPSDSQDDNKEEYLGSVLLNASFPLGERFNALFELRTIASEEAVSQVSRVFDIDENSALLKHELAYCLGQMGRVSALPVLNKVLRDQSQHPMVRHEAAEALGAIGCQESVSVLEEFFLDPSKEVQQTCQLALAKIKSSQDEAQFASPNEPFLSIDPAPPSRLTNVPTLEAQLLDAGLDLYKRYRALFALRNMRSQPAVLALCKGLSCTDSALFRHEVAYVLGQLENPISAPYLQACLADLSEHAMVRHECAEALGAIAPHDPSVALPAIQHYTNDPEHIVRESCEVALQIFANSTVVPAQKS